MYLVQHMLHQIKAQQLNTDLGLYQQFKDFTRLLSDYPVLFKADFIFKDFSRKPSKFKLFSSLCKPWGMRAIQISNLGFMVITRSGWGLQFFYHGILQNEFL